MADLEDRENRERRLAAAIMFAFGSLATDFLRSGRFSQLRLQAELEDAIGDELRRTHLAAGTNFLQTLPTPERYKVDGRRELAVEWSRDYSGESAALIAENTKSWIGRLRDAGKTREEIARQVFGRPRAKAAAIGAVTDAISASEMTLASKLRKDGLTLTAIWRTARDERVCPVCEPLNGKAKKVWGRKFPNGPKAHPRCRCYLSWEVQIA